MWNSLQNRILLKGYNKFWSFLVDTVSILSKAIHFSPTFPDLCLMYFQTEVDRTGLDAIQMTVVYQNTHLASSSFYSFFLSFFCNTSKAGYFLTHIIYYNPHHMVCKGNSLTWQTNEKVKIRLKRCLIFWNNESAFYEENVWTLLKLQNHKLVEA